MLKDAIYNLILKGHKIIVAQYISNQLSIKIELDIILKF